MLTRKPRKGDTLSLSSGERVIVTRLDGRICWFRYATREEESCFIWGFSSPGGPKLDRPDKIDGGPEGWLYPNQLATLEE